MLSSFCLTICISMVFITILFTIVSYIHGEYCPIPLNFFTLFVIFLTFILYHSYFLIAFIFYMLIGYFLSFSFVKSYWKKGNKFNFSINDYKIKIMLLDMMLFWPVFLISKFGMKIKTPINELKKELEEK